MEVLNNIQGKKRKLLGVVFIILTFILLFIQNRFKTGYFISIITGFCFGFGMLLLFLKKKKN